MDHPLAAPAWGAQVPCMRHRDDHAGAGESTGLGDFAGEVERLGADGKKHIVLSAPGDRRDKEGNLWFDFPSVGGPGPKINIETEPAKPERFIQHTSLVRKDDDDWLGAPNWVGASGVIGVRKVRVPLKLADTKTFTRVSVTLVFGLPPGETRDTDPRIFAISINGETVQSEFNLNKATLGPTGFKAPIGWGTRAAQVSTSVSLPKGENEIEITLTPQDGGRETVLSGIEISVKN